jgi:hypothetical protein
MQNEDYEYSIASQIAYDYYHNNMDDVKTQEILDTYMPGYEIDDELSTLNHVVIKRPDDSAILAYRGTDPTNPYDLMADVIIAGGVHRDAINVRDTRFNLAEQYYLEAKNKYNALDLSGYSLGGTLADLIGTKYQERSTVFNPGASPLEFVGTSHPKSTAKVYKTNTLDLISMASRGYANVIEVPQTEEREFPFLNIRSHDIKNFLPSMDMLPLTFDGDPDVIIPFIPPTTPVSKEERIEIIKEENIQQQLICDLQPELAPSICKPKLKLKKIDLKI